MAGQFDKWKKILSTSDSRPDRYRREPDVNAEGRITRTYPEIVAPAPTFKGSDEDPNKNRSLPVNADLKAQEDSLNIGQHAVDTQWGEVAKNTRKRMLEGLKTTTMRLDENTGEAYDLEDRKPTPSGRVKPARKANPKYLAADVQRQNEDLATFTEADRRNSGIIRNDDKLAEESFNDREAKSGSTLRSVNGYTYDLREFSNNGDMDPLEKGGPMRQERPSTHDLEQETWGDSLEDAREKGRAKGKTYRQVPPAPVQSGPSSIVPTKPLNSKMAETREEEVEPEESAEDTAQRVQLKEVREYEQKSKGPTKVEYGDTLSEANKRSKFGPRKTRIEERPVYERPKAYTEGDIDESAAYEGDWKKNSKTGKVERIDTGKLKPGYDDPNSILSTTMREEDLEGPAAPAGTKKVKVISPRESLPYDKPEVTKPGHVIPPIMIDTYTSGESDEGKTLEEIEEADSKKNKNLIPPLSTTVYDPNNMPGKNTTGRTPQRRAVQAAIRSQRAADLAAEGKTMTTVRPEIMDSAKALAKTSRFGITDESYFDTPEFLDHPAIQEATIAHATGTHHDFSLVQNALGKVAPEAQRRREAWYKVAQRKLNGKAEKKKGEFEVLQSLVGKGRSITGVTRNIESGKKAGITINGQSPTLAEPAPIADVRTPTRAADRRTHANTAANLMFQQQQAARDVHKQFTQNPLSTTTMRLNESTGEAYDTDNEEELLANTANSSGGTTAGIAPAGSDTVTVSNRNKPGVAPVTRPFNPVELRNKKNVPSVDDSRTGALGSTGTTSVSVPRNSENYADTIMQRLQAGKKDSDE
jgi:hypothetical protein